MKDETVLYEADKVLVTGEVARFPRFWPRGGTKTFQIAEVADIETYTIPANKERKGYAPRDFLIFLALTISGVILACGGAQFIVRGLLDDNYAQVAWSAAGVPLGLLALWGARVFSRTRAKRPEDVYAIRLNVEGRWVDVYASPVWETVHRIAEAVRQARSQEDEADITEEAVFFDDGRITVNPEQAVFEKTAYRVDDILSVSTPNLSKAMPRWNLCLLQALAALSCGSGLVGIMILYSVFSVSPAENDSSVEAVTPFVTSLGTNALSLGVICALGFVGVVIWLRRRRSYNYAVRLEMVEGDVDALVSGDWAYIHEVAEAIRRALEART